MEIQLSQNLIPDNSNNNGNQARYDRISPLKRSPSKALQKDDAKFIQVLQNDSLQQSQKNKSFQSSTKTPQSSLGAKDSLMSQTIISRDEIGVQSYPLLEDFCFENEGEQINRQSGQQYQQQNSFFQIMEQHDQEEDSDDEDDSVNEDQSEDESEDENDSDDSFIHSIWSNADDDLIVRGIDIKNWKDRFDNNFNIFNLYKARSGQFLTHRENLPNYLVCKNLERFYNSYSKERNISENAIQSHQPFQTAQVQQGLPQTQISSEQVQISGDDNPSNGQQSQSESSQVAQQSKFNIGKQIKVESEKQQILAQKKQIIAEKYQILSEKPMMVQKDEDNDSQDQNKRKRKELLLTFKEYLEINSFKDTNDYTQSGFSHILFDKFKEYYIKYKKIQEKKYNFCPTRFKKDFTSAQTCTNLDLNPQKFIRNPAKKFTVDVFKSPVNKPIKPNQPKIEKSIKLNQNFPQKFYTSNDLSENEDNFDLDQVKTSNKIFKPLNFKISSVKQTQCLLPQQKAAVQENQNKIDQISEEIQSSSNKKNSLTNQHIDFKSTPQKIQTMTSIKQQNKCFDEFPLSPLKGKLQSITQIQQIQTFKTNTDSQESSQKNQEYEQILAPLKEELNNSKIQQLSNQRLLKTQKTQQFNQTNYVQKKRLFSTNDFFDDITQIKQNESPIDFTKTATNNNNIMKDKQNNIEVTQNNDLNLNRNSINLSPNKKIVNQQKNINSQINLQNSKADDFKKLNQEQNQKNIPSLISNEDNTPKEQNQSIINKLFHNKYNPDLKLKTQQSTPTKLSQNQLNNSQENSRKQSQNYTDRPNLIKDAFNLNSSNDISPISKTQSNSSKLNEQSPIYFLAKNKNQFHLTNQINSTSQENSQSQTNVNRKSILSKLSNQSSILNQSQLNTSQMNNTFQLDMSQLNNQSDIYNLTQIDSKNNKIYNQKLSNNVNQNQYNSQNQLNNQIKIKSQTQHHSQSPIKNKTFQNNSKQRLFQRLYDDQTDDSFSKVDESQVKSTKSNQNNQPNFNKTQQDFNLSQQSLNQYYMPQKNEQNNNQDKFKSVLSFESMASNVIENNIKLKKQSLPTSQQLQQSLESMKNDKFLNLLNSSESSLGATPKSQQVQKKDKLQQIVNNSQDKYITQIDRLQNNKNSSLIDTQQRDSPTKLSKFDNQSDNMIFNRTSISNNNFTLNSNNVKNQFNPMNSQNNTINNNINNNQCYNNTQLNSNDQFNSMNLNNSNSSNSFNKRNQIIYKQNNITSNGFFNSPNKFDINNNTQEKKNIIFPYSKNNLKEFFPLKTQYS